MIKEFFMCVGALISLLISLLFGLACIILFIFAICSPIIVIYFMFTTYLGVIVLALVGLTLLIDVVRYIICLFKKTE